MQSGGVNFGAPLRMEIQCLSRMSHGGWKGSSNGTVKELGGTKNTRPANHLPTLKLNCVLFCGVSRRCHLAPTARL